MCFGISCLRHYASDNTKKNSLGQSVEMTLASMSKDWELRWSGVVE